MHDITCGGISKFKASTGKQLTPTSPSPSSPCRGKTIMLDCGIHPGYTGNSSLPYLDSDDVDLEKVSGERANKGMRGRLGKEASEGGTGTEGDQELALWNGRRIGGK